ncbi:type II toxin-antitoxin system VapB family antitoxin [Thermococcus sp.]
MAVISVRVPDELKEKMKKYDINWSEEIRRFIELRVREIDKEKLLDEIDSFLENVPELPKRKATKLVRDDRDSN